MENKYVLLVCPILKDGRDIAGNPYRGVGEFIQAKKFIRDGNTDTGLYGFLWGKCPVKIKEYFLKLNWAVVKTELNENFIMLDRRTNEAKFKRGIILHMGKIKSCANYVLSIKEDAQQFFDEASKELEEEQIIGSTKWKKKVKEIR
jgi:hypothetical protein